VLAHALAVALALATAGSGSGGTRKPQPRRQPSRDAPALDLEAENAFRARRGLLPRKVRRVVPSGKRRLVLVPPSPAWLGEQLATDEPVPAAVTASAPVAASAPIAALAPLPVVAIPEEITDASVVRAALQGASVEILLVRRAANGEGPFVDATVEGALVDAVLLRRRVEEP
jgi:hypothetical protein